MNGRILYERLTETAKSELPHVVKQIIDAAPERFVEFYNTAQPMSIRTHALELLPGVGKKHMREILVARRERPFTSFDDVKARVKLLMDPKKLILNRIMNEIEGKEKHFLFVAPPPAERDDRRPRRRF